MASDMVEAHEHVKAVVDRAANVRAGMEQLLSYCARLQPFEGLAAMAALDFEDDQKLLRKWLVEVLTDEPPPEWIKAFWFGLADRAIDNGGTTCCLYVSGSTEYDPQDQAFDWASDPEYFPDRRYAPSRVLDAICQRLSSANPEARQLARYVLCLGYAALAVREVCNSIEAGLLVGEAGPRAVAVGFDAGDGLGIR